MTSRRAVLFVTLGLFAACSDDATDGSDVDAPPGADVLLAGEYIDWDSSASAFRGILAATVTVRGDATRTMSTPPNGRLNLMIPGDPFVTVDISGGMDPNGTETYVPGILVVNTDFAPDSIYSLRSFTPSRALDFNFQPTAAHVFVHVEGGNAPVEVGASHDAGQHYDGTTWSTGSDGTDVYLPNVAVGSGMTTITVTGKSGLPSMIPLEAGKLTYVVAR